MLVLVLVVLVLACGIVYSNMRNAYDKSNKPFVWRRTFRCCEIINIERVEE